jgi:uncharacterized protein (DUF427 family)
MSTQLHAEKSSAPTAKAEPASSVRIEDSPRRVRAYFGGVAVADSRKVLLVWESRRPPIYYFPVRDVRMDLLTAAGAQAEKTRFSIKVGSRVAENAAWGHTQPGPERERLKDYIAFFWNQMDSWYEEDDEVFVHPRDPYVRVDVLNSSRHVRVEVNGQVLADTHRPRLLFETGLPTRYYIPKQDVRMDLLEATDTETSCPYKGRARYWSAHLGDAVLEDVVWSYPAPIPECPKIENLLSFYSDRVDVYVDGEVLPRPQPRQ